MAAARWATGRGGNQQLHSHARSQLWSHRHRRWPTTGECGVQPHGRCQRPPHSGLHRGGTASFGSDYSQRGATSLGATSGTITFAPGASVAILTLDPSSDAVSNGIETIALSLAPGIGYAVGRANTVSGTIRDNDAAPGTVVRGKVDGTTTQRGARSLNWAAFAALKTDGSVITWGGKQEATAVEWQVN